MLDSVVMADLVKQVVAGGFAFALCGKAVGKFFAIVGEYFFDFERGFFNEAFDKRAGIFGGFVLENLKIYPATGTVDGDTQVLMVAFIGHFGQ